MTDGPDTAQVGGGSVARGSLEPRATAHCLVAALQQTGGGPEENRGDRHEAKDTGSLM